MYIKTFHQIRKEDVATVGGKGANLGEMTAAGIPVPRGFVVTAEGYRYFMRHNRYDTVSDDLLREAGNDETALCNAAEKIRSMIIEGQLPEDLAEEIVSSYRSLPDEDARVAVRSSATAEDLPDASFAGQQETYLNVRGTEELLAFVRKCYASLWGNRAVCYRLNQGYDQQSVALAVVVQEMVESEKAGVLFTVNPVTKDPSQIQINASYGLGESVVSGRVTADSVLCDKAGNVLSYEIGSKNTQIIYADQNTQEVEVEEASRKMRSLSDEEVSKLCFEAKRIEASYGYPMDIEWAIRGGKIYILQARAITTLGTHADSSEDDALVAEYLKGCKISGVGKENMAFQLEKMPYAYRPLDYDLMIQINTQKMKILREAGIDMTSDPRMDDDGIMTLPNPHKGITKNIFHLPGIIKELKDGKHCAQKCTEFMPRYEKKLADMAGLSFESMSVKECGDFLSMAYELLGELCYDRFRYALFPSVISGNLTKAVKRIDPKYTNYDLYKGLDNKTSVITREVASMAEKLRDKKEIREAILSGIRYEALIRNYPECLPLFETFLKENGFKSDFNCYCVIAKTLKEDPDRLLNILRPLLSSAPTQDSSDPAKEYEEMLQKLSSLYRKKYPALKEQIDAFRLFHIVREESQYLWETLFYYVRRCLQQMNRLLLGGDDFIGGISNLFYRELSAACIRGALNDSELEKIRRRSGKHALSQKVWDASKLLVFDADGETLKGVSGSSGTAIGSVCIIHSPSEFYKMKKGDILVCELTDPEWTPLFSLASAVVADTGSSLSHAAIVAREFGIPAVLGVGFATARFQDGETIKVDGDNGVVSTVK